MSYLLLMHEVDKVDDLLGHGINLSEGERGREKMLE